MSKDPYRTNDRRVIPWLLLGLVVLFGGAYVAGYLLTSDRVPRGTTVSGVEIGGLTPARARATLEEELAERRTRAVVVTALGQRFQVAPARAGLDIDVAASVEQGGGGRSWHPARIWDSLTSGDDLDAVIAVDDDALEERIAAIAGEADTPAEDGAVVFRGDRAVARMPTRGEQVDQEAAAQAVRDSYLIDESPVALPTLLTAPEIDKADVSAAMNDFANPAVSGAVRLELRGRLILLQPRDFTPALSMVPVDGALEPEVDGRMLVRRVEPQLRSVSLAPRDATVALVGGRPQVVPAKKGVTLDEEALVEDFLGVVARTGEERTLEAATVSALPDVTTADARRLGVTELVSEFTTYFPHSDYRNTNLGRAAELVNGTLLEPGERFSLNRIVGERTAKNGFAKGLIISDGVFIEDFGGGVSQVATTTFNAMFFAGLEDIEHKPHSFYIDRYPVGREATVAWPYVDLRFENDTPYGVLVQAFIKRSTPSTSGAMTVRMWSTKYWDIKASQSARYNSTVPAVRQLSGEDCVPNVGYDGFDIDVYRSFFRVGSDKLHHREKFHTTYTPSDTVICS